MDSALNQLMIAVVALVVVVLGRLAWERRSLLGATGPRAVRQARIRAAFSMVTVAIGLLVLWDVLRWASLVMRR